MTTDPSVGGLLRHWRQRRRFSQLALALEAGISQRHLSFVESGRAHPSRDMVLRLGEQLEMPLGARNALLVAAGFAPRYPQLRLDAPEMAAARAVIERILRAHMPNPALAVNRLWELQMANDAVRGLLDGVAPPLLEPPVNVLRVSLHPDGLARRIANLGEWRAHVLARLDREAEGHGDPRLAALRDELAALPVPPGTRPHRPDPRAAGQIAVPLRLRTTSGTLSYLSTTTVFGTATEVTLADLTVECFYPSEEGA